MDATKDISLDETGLAVEEMWLLVRYRPTAFFSLRMTHATNKGGRTLLVPTPYAFKLALVDAAFRAWPGTEAPTRAKELFSTLLDLEIRFLPPEHAVVQHTFIKIRDAVRGNGDDDQAAGPYKPSIAFREFVHYQGDLVAALQVTPVSAELRKRITHVAAHVQSIGKRGSFFQYLGHEHYRGALPQGFTAAESPAALLSGRYATTQYLDDLGPKLKSAKDAWEKVSTYGSKSLRLGEDRVLVRTLLPYRVRAEGHSFTAYERLGGRRHAGSIAG